MLIIRKIKLPCYKLTSQNTRLAPLALNSPKNILASKSYEDNYICIKIHYFISLFHDLRNWKTAKILELIYFGVCDRPSGLYRPSLSRLPFLWSISAHPGWDNSLAPIYTLVRREALWEQSDFLKSITQWACQGLGVWCTYMPIYTQGGKYIRSLVAGLRLNRSNGLQIHNLLQLCISMLSTRLIVTTWGNLLPSRQRMYYTYVPGLYLWDECLRVLCTAAKRKYPRAILPLKMPSWHQSFLE